MPISVNLTTSRWVLFCISTLVLCACFVWTGSVVAAPLQDEPAAVPQEQPQVDENSDENSKKIIGEPTTEADPGEWQTLELEVEGAEGVADAVDVEEGVNGAAMMLDMGMDSKKMQSAKRFTLAQTFQVEVEVLTRILDLDAKQKKRLSIAAKGATIKLLAQWREKRGMNQGVAEEKRAETDDEEVEITDADQIDETTLMMMDMDMNTGSPFGARSPLQNPAWKKMLTKVLTTEQLTTLEHFRAEQADTKKAAQIATMMEILNVELGLSSAQSDELKRLITPHLDAAKPFSMPLYDSFLMLYYASKVDEGELKKLFSDAQHQKFKILMVPMKQIGTMMEQQAGAEDAVGAEAVVAPEVVGEAEEVVEE